MINILIGLVFASLQAFVQAFAMSKAWTWFIASQYGPGPAYHTWYGVALLISLVQVAHMRVDPSTKATMSSDDLLQGVSTSLGRDIVLMIVLGIAWCVGNITGWIS